MTVSMPICGEIMLQKLYFDEQGFVTPFYPLFLLLHVCDLIKGQPTPGNGVLKGGDVV